MPIDRPAILRNAEKLLRQGKLDQAVAEYQRLVDDQPADWNTANVLGDLHVRAKQPDKAVEQFVRIADHLHAEGFLSKAAAVYKKVLKLKPDHEHAMLQAAEIAGGQGLVVDARALFNSVANRRRTRGDQRGVTEIVVRLASLDPNDVEARIAGARARTELNDTAGAVGDLKALAAYLQDKDRQAEAIKALQEAAALDASDDEVRGQLMDVHLVAGDFTRAREYASSAAQLKAIAERLEAAGDADEALLTLQEAAGRDPDDIALKAQLGRTFAGRGDLQAAGQYLTIESAGSDPRLLWTAAEIQLRGGKLEEAIAAIRRLLDLEPDRRDEVAALGWTQAEQAPDAGFAVVQLAAEAAIQGGDYASAAAVLQEYVTRLPGHIPTLTRLVGICVDGGLEATMYSAQGQLADAYIAAGSGDQARFISEELVAREPWERANIERFRRALVLLGDADPDAVIADRLSGNMPFMSTDLARTEDAGKAEQAAPVGETTPPPIAPAAHPEPVQDLEPPAPISRWTAAGEVDLSVVLDDINRPIAVAVPPLELEGVFAQVREEPTRRPAVDPADADYRQGLALLESGKAEEAIGPLQAAARTPRLRFDAASLVGRILRDRGRLAQAIEWLERAAQAPAPTPDQGHVLLFDLADVLEQAGETSRALAVCIELQADAGNYRDVAARIERLAKVRARG